MALEMTAQEYEEKYGIKPFTNVTNVTSTEQKTNQPKERGIISGALKRPLERLVLEPARRLGETVGYAATSKLMTPEQKQKALGETSKDKSINVPVLGEFKTKGVKPGKEGLKQIAGETIETGAYLTPGPAKGASIGTKAAVGGATGYGFDVAADLQAGKDVKESLKPGIGTAVGTALPILGGIIGKFPKKMEEVNLRMTPTEQRNLAKQGKDIADYMARKKIVGSPESRYAKIDTLYEKMEDQIGNLVKTSGKTYSKQDIISQLKSVPEEFIENPAGYQEAVNASNRVIKFLQEKAPDQIPASTLQTYKRNLWKSSFSKNNADVVNEALYQAGSKLKDILDTDIASLKGLNREYGLLLNARKILFKATTKSQTGLVGKALGTIAGTAIGGGVAGPIGAAGGAVAGEQIASKVLGTRTRSLVGATIQGLMDVLQKIPTDKSGNLQITQKALITMLQDFLGEDMPPQQQ